MAVIINSTKVITNIPNVDWGRLVNVPANTISSLIKTSIGNNTNPIGSPGVRVNDVAYSPANTTLTVNFDTDCTSACACACGG